MRPDLPSGTVTFLFTDIDGSTKLLHERRSVRRRMGRRVRASASTRRPRSLLARHQSMAGPPWTREA